MNKNFGMHDTLRQGGCVADLERGCLQGARRDPWWTGGKSGPTSGRQSPVHRWEECGEMLLPGLTAAYGNMEWFTNRLNGENNLKNPSRTVRLCHRRASYSQVPRKYPGAVSRVAVP
jgi:hypothetical protein